MTSRGSCQFRVRRPAMAKSLVLFSLLIAGVAVSGQTGVTYVALPDAPQPCLVENRANGINPSGDIVGRCKDGAGNPRSWVLPNGSSTPTLIDFTSAPFTPTLGSTTRAINARGDIVGRYFDSSGHSHGYLLSGGRFTGIDAPFAGTT